jgi:hypothetical protein
MSLFSRNRKRDVQALVLSLVNNGCPELRLAEDCARLEQRTNLTVPVLVVPIEEGEPVLDRAFATVTKEFATSGVSLVLGELHSLDEAVLVFQGKAGEIILLRGRARHLSPLGAGFFQLGIRLTEVIPPGDYPRLAELASRF